MSEVTTLRQLMLDAARYRWLRKNFIVVDWSSLYECDDDGAIDKFIDEELNRE